MCGRLLVLAHAADEGREATQLAVAWLSTGNGATLPSRHDDGCNPVRALSHQARKEPRPLFFGREQH